MAMLVLGCQGDANGNVGHGIGMAVVHTARSWCDAVSLSPAHLFPKGDQAEALLQWI